MNWRRWACNLITICDGAYDDENMGQEYYNQDQAQKGGAVGLVEAAVAQNDEEGCEEDINDGEMFEESLSSQEISSFRLFRTHGRCLLFLSLSTFRLCVIDIFNCAYLI